jgi:hypothetical protein
LTSNQEQAFVSDMCARLRALTDALQNGRVEVLGQAPAEAEVLNRVLNWLAAHDGRTIAATPRAV